MDWPDEPASEQQVIHLRRLGVAATPNLTMTEAARLIRQCQRNLHQTPSGTNSYSRANSSPASSTPPGKADSVQPREPSLAPRFHQTTVRAKRLIPMAPVATCAPADLAAARVRRVDFWLDTCRDMREMVVGNVQVYQLHHDYGHRLFAPTREQAEEILDALDTALPSWDKEHPELFYKTLELNYPDLIRNEPPKGI